MLAPVLFLTACALGACGASHSTLATGSSHSSSGSQIVIKNFAFKPDDLTVHPGQVVSVKNEDPVTHTLTSDSKAFDTGDIPGGTTAHFTAPEKAGTYEYRCSIHQYMTGTIVVSNT